jgi:predicted ArsR family transcriptional regulator
MEGLSFLNSQVPATKRQVLLALKQHGALTVDDLASQLGISAVAVRRHLSNLERDQLVEHQQEKRSIGRPSFIFELTEAGHMLFPERYDQLANDILQAVDHLYGKEGVEQIFRHTLTRQLADYLPHLDGKPLKERVQQLTQLREAEGYMATWEQIDGDTFLIHQYNCPILKVAQWCRATCAEATSLLSQLLDAEVSRQSHQADGDASCTFLVRPH